MSSFGIVNFGLFCLAVMLLNATPGPDTAYIIGRSVAQGRAAGLVSALGISVGCLFHSIASAFGLTALLATSATAFGIIKLAGGAYLVYLGIRMMLAKPAHPTDAPVPHHRHETSSIDSLRISTSWRSRSPPTV